MHFSMVGFTVLITVSLFLKTIAKGYEKENNVNNESKMIFH